MSTIMDGKLVAKKIREEIRLEIEELKKEGKPTPGFAGIILGEDPSNKTYIKNKKKACKEVGIRFEEYALPEETPQDELLKLIDTLNKKDDIHGILVQASPLPKQINENIVFESISPAKDVDAFHPQNVGRIMIGKFDFLPCTPAGVMALLEYYNIDVKGKDCVVVGRSNIVGKPQAMLMLHKDATVTICHSKTKDLTEKTKKADILVAAMRQPKFIKADMIKEGAVVIDVGINRGEDGKLCGDVDFEEVSQKASYITPVPGGVGPMTITILLKNTLTACKNANK